MKTYILRSVYLVVILSLSFNLCTAKVAFSCCGLYLTIDETEPKLDDCFWPGKKVTFAGTLTGTEVWSGAYSTGPVRMQIEIRPLGGNAVTIQATLSNLREYRDVYPQYAVYDFSAEYTIPAEVGTYIFAKMASWTSATGTANYVTEGGRFMVGPGMITVVQVEFNGIDIRWDTVKDVIKPEWVLDRAENYPTAYLGNKNFTLKAWFRACDPGITSARIRATGFPPLESLNEETVYFTSGWADAVEFQAFQRTPDEVRKDVIGFNWKARDINGTGSPEINLNESGPHEVFTILDKPNPPMEEPWVGVLEFATRWAMGQRTATGSLSEITKNVYDNIGFYYETSQGRGSFSSLISDQVGNIIEGYFNLGKCLFELKRNIGFTGNCHDAACIITTFANAIGCSNEWLYIARQIPNRQKMYLNCIDPVGIGMEPTNNPFVQLIQPIEPLIWHDGRRGGFGNHGVSAYRTKIYDGVLRYDVDRDPDNVINSGPRENPPEGVAVPYGGHLWELPVNVPWNKVYKRTFR